MKRLLACLVALVMSVLMLAACGANNGTADSNSNNAGNTGSDAAVESNGSLTNAKNYLFTMYKDAASLTPMDFIRVGAVRIDGVSYPIEWSADTDLISFEYDDAVKMVTIKVDNSNKEDVNYSLTATLTDANGATESVSFPHCIPASKSYEDIVKDAYTLEAGANMDGTFRLEGVITKIDTAWSDEYKNITVTIQVGDLADMPIMCYRLKGDGAQDLAVTDTITVTGMIKNYNGTIEFDAGCVLEKVIKGEGAPEVEQPEVPDVDMSNISAVLDAAYALTDGQSLNAPATLKGVITKIDTEWSDQYNNITVTIVVDGKDAQPIMCFRLKGDGAKELAVGDTITATGTLKNYKGTIEFDAGCTLDAVVKGSGSAVEDTKPAEDEKPATEKPATLAAQIAEANKLANKEFLPYESTITGVITDDPQASSRTEGSYKFTVSDGTNSLLCYYVPVAGGTPKKGDTVTVTGKLTAYNGAAQFSDSNSSATWISAGTAEPEKPAETLTDAEAILKAGYALAEGEKMSGSATLTGKITKVDTEWSDQYKNITVTIVVDGFDDKPIMCFRLKGDGAKELAVGDTITVTGTVMNYKGTVEFDAGCTLDAVVKP